MRSSKTPFWDHCMILLHQEQLKRDPSLIVFVLCPGDKKVSPFSSSLSEYEDLYLPWKDLVDVGDSLMNIFSFPVVCSAFSRKRGEALERKTVGYLVQNHSKMILLTPSGSLLFTNSAIFYASEKITLSPS